MSTEPSLGDLRGLRYLQNKIEFQNRQVHIDNDLKWSLQHQSGLEMPKLAPDWHRQQLSDQVNIFRRPAYGKAIRKIGSEASICNIV